ncbi:MAG: exodeoxyribonuclease VII small subunit [Gammaproteobacteria bacterium]|jgi:exodeoxyribonuclease VII small subunit|nr:exodeoxyribonuclease VII small subunit [Gammaproteobacteria bacterium]|tara:strand:- start:304 stop:525 length:222 start_codon:yes stop_codon:yes gene_type:complete
MAKSDKQSNFESSLNKLELIVTKLEDENISLEDSVKSFEEGINLVKSCQEELKSAELKIQKLLDDGTSEDIET